MMINVKRICQKDMIVTHCIGAKILHQLKINPEVCEDCDIEVCIFAKYIYGKPKKK